MVYRQSENHARLSYKVYIQNIHKNHPTSGLKSEKIKPDFIIKDPPDYKVYTMESPNQWSTVWNHAWHINEAFNKSIPQNPIASSPQTVWRSGNYCYTYNPSVKDEKVTMILYNIL